MKHITFYRRDFVLDSEGNSMFDSLLTNASIVDTKKEIEEIEITFDLINIWNEEGEEILDGVKST